MPDFSILLSHLHTTNDIRALRVTLDTIVHYTRHDYELLLWGHHEPNVYAMINRMARAATTDWLLLHTTDQFVSPDWDVPLWEARGEDTLVVGGMVESGYQPVAEQCLEMNFGMSPETYREADFNAFVAGKPGLPAVESWSWPWLIHRERFLEMGGFAEISSADMLFYQRWRAGGFACKRAQSYCYHLMSWSKTGAQR